MEKLALLGGPKAITADPGDMFLWPIITQEDEDAILDVLHRRAMSGLDVTRAFEAEFAQWQQRTYALASNNGTSAILTALYGLGIGAGDEVICPSSNYWASVLQLFNLGATPVFADIDLDTLCIKPEEIERVVSPRTKAIVCVHQYGHPCDMDPILELAKRYNLKVLEDLSHAHGGYYKGKKLGTFGDVAAMSIMTGKAFATGEGGILVTDNREIYERAIAYGHYERFSGMETEYLRPVEGLPLGGMKLRIHQMSSAMGRVQLKYYDSRMEEIQKSMNYFWDLLEGVPGIRPHRVREEGSTMGGWYSPRGLYRPEELGGLSIVRFCQALAAEGVPFTTPGCYAPLHSHEMLKTYDIYGEGKPTRIVHAHRDVRLLDTAETLRNTEIAATHTFEIPNFRHFRPEEIAQYAAAYRKVCENYAELLPGDTEEYKSFTGNRHASHHIF